MAGLFNLGWLICDRAAGWQKNVNLRFSPNWREALAAAQTLPEVKALRDKAEAARTFAKAARLGLDLQNQAAEYKLRAERKAGGMLAKLNLRGGDRRSKNADQRLSLEDLGVSRGQSRRWQLVATLSEREFNGFLSKKKEGNEEITLAEVLRLARSRRDANGHPDGKGVADPGSPCQIARGTNSPHDVILELRDHYQLLSQILEPITASDESGLPLAEHRLTMRLLRETNTLLAQLERSWKTNTSDGVLAGGTALAGT